MANVLELKKNVVTFTEDKKEWKWKEFSLGQICKSKAYGSVKIKFGKEKVELKNAVAYYQKLQNEKNWATARKVKDLIWSALDEKSRERIKSFYDIPEVRIASVERELPEDDTIVAFYALIEENYYNGVVESIVPGNYVEYINNAVFINKPNGVKKIYIRGKYEEEHIIGGNGNKSFVDYMETSPKYTWLPKAIAVAKQFDITPNWQPCVYSGRRGIGLTAHDAKELQIVANWYSGLADIDKEDIKCDWSDKIWLHHENGVDSIQISVREYEQNKERWQDWKQTENRDFRCDLYEDEEDLV